eukprot:scaffold21169_cov125-Isochrysis_galbana.AAC.5
MAMASTESALIESSLTRGKVHRPRPSARMMPTLTSRANTRGKSEGAISPAPSRRTSSAMVWPEELPPPPTSMVKKAARTTWSDMRPSNASITQPEADCTSIRPSSHGKRAATVSHRGVSKYSWCVDLALAPTQPADGLGSSAWAALPAWRENARLEKSRCETALHRSGGASASAAEEASGTSSALDDAAPAFSSVRCGASDAPPEAIARDHSMRARCDIRGVHGRDFEAMLGDDVMTQFIVF